MLHIIVSIGDGTKCPVTTFYQTNISRFICYAPQWVILTHWKIFWFGDVFMCVIYTLFLESNLVSVQNEHLPNLILNHWFLVFISTVSQGLILNPCRTFGLIKHFRKRFPKFSILLRAHFEPSPKTKWIITATTATKNIKMADEISVVFIY